MENKFNYYYDEENNIMYIPRKILELARTNNLEIEGNPKIINNSNCYSIHYKELKKLEEKLNLLSNEIKISEKKNLENVVIVYKLMSNNNLYSTENLWNTNKETEDIMGKTCYKTDINELESIYNKKFIIVSVFGKNKKQENTQENIITICNYNNMLFIEDKNLKILNTETEGRKKIKVNGTLYIETIDKEIQEIQNTTNGKIVTRNIVPVNN